MSSQDEHFQFSNFVVSDCGPDQFSCKDRLKCIPKSQVCDFAVDCFDGSDEDQECCMFNKQRNVSLNYFITKIIFNFSYC